MANWLVDTGNTKRGFYFTHLQELFKNGVITREEDNSITSSIANGDTFMGYHSSIDPRNLIIFDDVNPETGEITTSIGLKRGDATVTIPLELDAVKAFLDSTDGEVSPVVALQYQFASPDAAVTTREAIENATYVTKVTLPDGTMRAINILNNATVWQSPNKKHVVNYVFFGKVNGIPDTYFMLLNSFRTELYNDLQTANGHNFFYLDQSTGGMKNYLLRPVISGAKLLDNDVIVAESDSFDINVFGSLVDFLSKSGLSAADINLTVSTNATYTDNGSGQLTFDMTGKNYAYISLKIGEHAVLDPDPRFSVRRTFTVHRG